MRKPFWIAIHGTGAPRTISLKSGARSSGSALWVEPFAETQNDRPYDGASVVPGR